MSITYKCKDCGGWQEARDRQAGKSVKCPDCKGSNIVPRASADAGLFDPQFDSGPAFTDPGRPSTASARPVRMTWDTHQPASAPTPPLPDNSKGNAWGGWGVLGFIAIIALKFFLRMPGNRGAQPPVRPIMPGQPPIFRPFQNPQAKVNGNGNRRVGFITLVNPKEPIEVPALPDLPPAREIEPGINLHELRLGKADAPIDVNPPFPRTHKPGAATRLWVYLPKPSDKPIKPGSIPCVLIPPSGGNLAEGLPLGPESRQEHLAYARAGFAVIAFDIEGYGQTITTNNGEKQTSSPSNSISYLLARAGLVNARVALEYALHKVPDVNTDQIFIVGSQSAGSLALLFAEFEPRIKACAVSDPIFELESKMPMLARQTVGALVGEQFFTLYSPRTHEAKLECPVLMMASEEEPDALNETRASVDRLKQMGKDATFEKLPDDDEDRTTARIIAWLKQVESKKKSDKP